MSSAKAVRKLKHIRKVKYAIRFREQTLERLAPKKEQRRAMREYMNEYKGSKSTFAQNAKAARKNAREDFELGPLRPNRAVGTDADKYGVLTRNDFHSPSLPEHWYGAKESVQKRMKTRIPDNVFRDQWPIVEGDRVLVLSGRDKNKIGVVRELMKERNAVVVEDINLAYLDGRAFNTQPGEKQQPKREITTMIPYEDIRLVIAQDVYMQEGGGHPRKVRQDVIVEAVEVEKHTKGINPFTGEAQHEIPKEEQLNPETEEVPYHRYIAGTRTPIPWPWESKRKLKKSATAEAPVPKQEEAPSGIFGKLRNAVGLKKKDATPAPADAAQATEEPTVDEVDPDAPLTPSTRPQARPPQPNEGDTLRHIVEGDSTFIPSLVMPPFPEEVVWEIRESSKERAKLEKESEDYEELLQSRKEKKAEGKAREEQARQERIAVMKTPLQIKWDLAQAKKKKYDPSEPPKVSRKFLYALGKQIAANNQQLRK